MRMRQPSIRGRDGDDNDDDDDEEDDDADGDYCKEFNTHYIEMKTVLDRMSMSSDTDLHLATIGRDIVEHFPQLVGQSGRVEGRARLDCPYVVTDANLHCRLCGAA